jgi:hypothetical protein
MVDLSVCPPHAAVELADDVRQFGPQSTVRTGEATKASSQTLCPVNREFRAFVQARAGWPVRFRLERPPKLPAAHPFLFTRR